ncbi:alpha/beta hydrolase [Terriglobus albidus]|uniref:alpha/beta hydrolase n=1 Tax=Terriglobus albidus TaxID=1592106 RepID=UPI0021E09474|nr:alpha/beta hydrolase [Terriglobus albidus]
MRKPNRLFLQCVFWGVVAALCWTVRLQAQTPDTGGTPYTYREVQGEALKAYVFSPQERSGTRHPAILMFHGGAWQLGDASWMFQRAREFAQDGMVAIAVEYRLSLHGQSPVEGVDDACAAFLWVRAHAAELHIDPDRVAGYGVSAGGHLVAAAATLPAISGVPIPAEARPNAMLLYSPALNTGTDAYFMRLMNGHGDPHQYSPSDFISSTLPPTLIIQGEKDSIVYADDAKTFCAKATQLHARCELHVYPNVGHLLTRNLKVQYKDFDSDPEDAADAHKREDEFLRSLHYVTR